LVLGLHYSTLAFLCVPIDKLVLVKIMHFLRRFGFPIIATSGLIALSVFLLVSFGEGFKILAARRNEITFMKRDRSAITLDMPWK
jgi:hypothetical protein